ncbi:hypothetical protein PV326_002019, partial [Microctonus aethiopoides]
KMESLPYLTLTLRIPMEWIMTDTSYNDTIIYLMTITEEYLNIHGSYEGLVIDIVGVQAILIINIMERIIWFRRIRIEDDPPITTTTSTITTTIIVTTITTTTTVIITTVITTMTTMMILM